jgi:methionyl-tRNA formyltransferase
MPCVDPLDRAGYFCLAGKNDIAVECLEHLLGFGIDPSRLCVVLNRDDEGRSTWQRSFGFHARRRGVAIRTLEEVKTIPELWFFSVEFDRILRPAEFASRRLFNVHFSRLPAYRGVATAVWPLLRGERASGVTFHRIDEGVDTGPIIHQRVFPIPESWTARDLYFRCLAEGAVLFREALCLLAEGRATERPQESAGASVFRRRDLDFSSLSIDFGLPRREVLARLRAFAFWEYQLPSVRRRKVWSAEPWSDQVAARPGSLRPLDAWRSVLTVADGEILLRFSPYDDLFAWAQGQCSEPPAFAAVPDMDLQDAQGWSALMKAAHAGRAEAIRDLVAAGASPNAANRRGTTPLMYAFSHMLASGDSRAFRALLELGANAGATDQHGRSIRDYAPPEKLPFLRSGFPSIFP